MSAPYPGPRPVGPTAAARQAGPSRRAFLAGSLRERPLDDPGGSRWPAGHAADARLLVVVGLVRERPAASPGSPSCCSCSASACSSSCSSRTSASSSLVILAAGFAFGAAWLRRPRPGRDHAGPRAHGLGPGTGGHGPRCPDRRGLDDAPGRHRLPGRLGAGPRPGRARASGRSVLGAVFGLIGLADVSDALELELDAGRARAAGDHRRGRLPRPSRPPPAPRRAS